MERRGLVGDVVAVGVMFAALGALSGHLVSSSREPAVTALLPLIFGLIAGFGVSYFEKRTRARQVEAFVKHLPTAEQERAYKELKVVPGAAGALPLPWLIGVTSFCLACGVGVWAGVTARLGRDVRLHDAIPVEALGTPTADSAPERAIVLRLLWEMRAASYDDARIQEVLDHVIAPVLTSRAPDRLARLKLVVQMLGSPEPAFAWEESAAQERVLTLVASKSPLSLDQRAAVFRLYSELRSANVPSVEIDALLSPIREPSAGFQAHPESLSTAIDAVSAIVLRGRDATPPAVPQTPDPCRGFRPILEDSQVPAIVRSKVWEIALRAFYLDADSTLVAALASAVVQPTVAPARASLGNAGGDQAAIKSACETLDIVIHDLDAAVKERTQRGQPTAAPAHPVQSLLQLPSRAPTPTTVANTTSERPRPATSDTPAPTRLPPGGHRTTNER